MLDRHDGTTKIVHYTGGGPWLEEWKEHPYGALWFRYRDEYLRSVDA
jgi:hypothetical protein